MNIRPGTTDVSIYAYLVDASTGGPYTTWGGYDNFYLEYVREGESLVSNQCDSVGLVSATSPHEDNKVYHCGDGIWRLDFEDGAFAEGVDHVLLLVRHDSLAFLPRAIRVELSMGDVVAEQIAEPNTLYVDAINGNDTNDGTSWNRALKTIGAANTLAGASGSTIERILVASGAYSESVTCVSGVHYKGMGPTTRISTPGPAVYLNDDVVIEGFYIEGSFGITNQSPVTDWMVKDCWIHSTADDIAITSGASGIHGIIRGCQFRGQFDGLTVFHSGASHAYIEVSDCDFLAAQKQLYLNNTSTGDLVVAVRNCHLIPEETIINVGYSVSAGASSTGNLYVALSNCTLRKADQAPYSVYLAGNTTAWLAACSMNRDEVSLTGDAAIHYDMDWYPSEIEQVRDALGITGSKTTATGGQLQEIRSKTNLIGSASITYTSPVVEDGVFEVYAGDDYDVDHNRALTLTVTDYAGPDLSGSGVSGVIRIQDIADYLRSSSGEADLEKTVTIEQDSDTVTVTIELSSSDTSGLSVSPPRREKNFAFQIVVTLEDGTEFTLASGRLTVRKKIEGAS